VTRGERIVSCVLVLLLVVTVASAHSQSQTATPNEPVNYWSVRPSLGELGESPVTDRVATQPASPTAKPRGAEFVLAPIPIVNPTLDNGLAVAVGELYTIDRGSPPSGTLGMGFFTSSDSWGAGLAQMLHLHDDRYRALIAGAYFDVNFDFFGIGSEAGDDGESIPLNQTGYGGMADFRVRLGRGWYAGPRYRFGRTTASADLSNALVTIPSADLHLRTASLGPHVERDTRSDQFYPRSGTWFDLVMGFAGEVIGGRRNYQMYQAAFSTYSSLSPRQVLATKVNSCFADGEVPFYDLCLLGQYQDIRGYQTGQYRDRAMLTAQAEYRLELRWRLGVVAFGGAGEVAEAFDKFTGSSVLPSGGAGLRFRLTEANHVNLRADYAWGKNSSALYISIAEAF
jgi:hypothetical protein